MKKIKKGLKVYLSAIMVFSVMLSAFPIKNADAKTVRSIADRVYSTGESTEVTNGEGAINASGDVNQFRELTDFTFQTTFTMTGSGVNSLFFIGDSSKESNYVTVYINDKTLGVESRNSSGTQQISNATIPLGDVDLRIPHKLTFTVSGGNWCRFYFDGRKIKEAAINVNFSQGIVSNADYMGFGNGKRSEGQNTYPFTGTLQDIELYKSALSEADILAYHSGLLKSQVYNYTNAYYPSIDTPRVKDNTRLTEIKALTKGSVSVRFKANSAENEFMSLFALANEEAEKSYIALYINPKENVIGVDAPGIENLHNRSLDLDLQKYVEKGVSVSNTQWHTLTLTKANDAIKFYLDGEYLDQWTGEITAGFFNLLADADAVGIGYIPRPAEQNSMPFVGAIDIVNIYSEVLDQTSVEKEHQSTIWKPGQEIDMTEAYKTEPQDLYYSGYDGSTSYRIPSLLKTTAGTTLAIADKRNSGPQDAGNIDIIVRRKEVGEKSFSDPTIMLDLVENSENPGSASFLIDVTMVQDKKSNRIFAAVDMFPECGGLADVSQLTTGTGYKEIDGKDYLILYDANKNEFGTVREENGIGYVFDNNNEKTEYTVILDSTAPYQERGNLYKNGEYKGNIYMLKDGPEKGELTVLNTQYLWMCYSDDDGKTWSNPVDLTPQVKENWMLFLGTGPGTGIQLENGNLLIPVYSANRNLGGSQSSAVIISNDQGKTWKLGDSPQKAMGNDRETMNDAAKLFTESQAIQLENGDVKLFMRNTYESVYAGKVHVATSTDGGQSWDKVEKIDINETWCQLSVLQYTKGEKEYVIMTNPDRSPRTEGKVHLGEVDEDGQIQWQYHQSLNSSKFQYSSLTILENDGENVKFGILYEDDTDSTFRLKYTEFDEKWIKAGQKSEEMEQPQVLDYNASVSGNELTIKVKYNQNIMVAGEPKLVLSSNQGELVASYESGSGTDTIIFKTNMPESIQGVLRATEFNVQSGYLENISNKSPSIKKGVVYDLTDIKDSMTIANYSSQHSASTAEGTDGAAVNVLDKNPKTYWHSNYGAGHKLPQHVVIDLGKETDIYKLGYLPRQNDTSGRVKDFEILGSNNGSDFMTITSGSFNTDADKQHIEFLPVTTRYVKFVVKSSTAKSSCAIAELNLYEYTQGIVEAGSKDRLSNLLTEVSKLQQKDYSSATWKPVEKCIGEAEELINAPIASQKMLDDASDKLLQAKKALVDIRKAIAKMEEINGLKEKDYLASSWAPFKELIKNMAEDIHASLISKDVTDVLVKAHYAHSLLIKRADNSELAALVAKYQEELKTMKPEDFKEPSWSVFIDVLKEANEILNDTEATRQKIDEVRDNLASARAALESDKEALQELYDVYIKTSSKEYTVDSWKAMELALKNAEKVLMDKKATPSDVKAAIKELEEARKGLKLVVDTEALEALYNELLSLDLTLYEQAGQDVFKKTMAEAKAMLANPQNNAEVQAMVGKLRKAYEALTLKSTDQPVDQPNDKDDKPGENNTEKVEKGPTTGDSQNIKLIVLLAVLSLATIGYTKKSKKDKVV